MGEQVVSVPYALDIAIRRPGLDALREHVPDQIRVTVLGTDDESFFCTPEFFRTSASRLGGEPVFSPPPFAAPCSDGLLVIYTLRRVSYDGSVDIHGGYVSISQMMLEEGLSPELSRCWRKAERPMNMKSMLHKLGFGDVSFSFMS